MYVSVKVQRRMRRVATAMAAVAIVLCVTLAPICASWCSGHGCAVDSVVPLVTAEHEGCHHAMNGGLHMGWSSSATDAVCPAGEFVVTSLKADVLAPASDDEVVALHSVAAVALIADFVAADDSDLRTRRSLGSSSFSPHVVSDSAISLRI
jgi:hypothetical protein